MEDRKLMDLIFHYFQERGYTESIKTLEAERLYLFLSLNWTHSLFHSFYKYDTSRGDAMRAGELFRVVHDYYEMTSSLPDSFEVPHRELVEEIGERGNGVYARQADRSFSLHSGNVLCVRFSLGTCFCNGSS